LVFDFEEFPKAFGILINGRPKFRCVVDVSKAEPKGVITELKAG